MNEIYAVEDGGKTLPFERVVCRDEDRELQSLLYYNLDLLPKEPLGVKESSQWLLIKREMPVPSPETGDDTWSVDFLLADTEAIPTLVECKRFADTRTRREVIGQMFEYAANGRSYWTEPSLRRAAEIQAGGEEAFRRILGDRFQGSYEEFFTKLTSNLKSGKMRLIFFLEKSPLELRSVVEFLSEQFTGLEVFLVEARQYQRGQLRVVVPWVFGYTEAARRVKQEERAATRAVVAEGERPETFWKAVEMQNSPALHAQAKDSLRSFVEFAGEVAGCELSWGRGPQFRFPDRLGQAYLFAIHRDGVLEWNFLALDPRRNPEADAERWTELTGQINQVFGTTYGGAGTKMYPQIASGTWLGKIEAFKLLIQKLAGRSG